jgi:hypothetical protein
MTLTGWKTGRGEQIQGFQVLHCGAGDPDGTGGGGEGGKKKSFVERVTLIKSSMEGGHDA